MLGTHNIRPPPNHFNKIVGETVPFSEFLSTMSAVNSPYTIITHGSVNDFNNVHIKPRNITNKSQRDAYRYWKMKKKLYT